MKLRNLEIGSWVYLLPSFTALTNVFEGLNAGNECAGMTIAVFFLISRPIFSALSFTIKDPNPLTYTFSPSFKESFTSLIDTVKGIKYGIILLEWRMIVYYYKESLKQLC